MKRLTILFIALTLLVSGAFVSCKKVKELLEITLHDVAYDVDINVSDLATKDGGYAFAGTATFDPSSNSELEPYLANIRRVVITEIKITVTSITPATGISLLNATFSLKDNVNNAEFTYQFTPKPLVAGAEFIIDNNAPDFSLISDIITNQHQSTVSIRGSVNNPGFVIDFNTAIKADITVGVPNGK